MKDVISDEQCVPSRTAVAIDSFDSPLKQQSNSIQVIDYGYQFNLSVFVHDFFMPRPTG